MSMCLRKLIVDRLYGFASLICVAADKLSPPNDLAWREHRQRDYENALAAREETEEVMLSWTDE